MSITKLFNKKKHVKGIPDKPRSRAEVDQEYQHHAIMYGHISRIMKQDSATMDKNQELLNQHLAHLIRLNEEGKKIPPEPKKEEAPAETKGPE